MTYVEDMRKIARSQYSKIYQGITRLRFFDFPDYPNVGDSAIALGQLAFFDYANIDVESAYCIGTLNAASMKTTTPAMINGGGNIAGFFDGIDRHRNGIAKALHPSAILIQAPQSIHFGSESAKKMFFQEFAARPGLRMAVRDSHALAEVTGILPNAILAPDAVHHLGELPSAPPTQKTLVLARTDRESQDHQVLSTSVDWNRDPKRTRLGTSLRWKSKYFGPLGKALNLQTDDWQALAQNRLGRGISTLAPGEIVVTDRLHAMLIALQMGRTVHAVDNANKKLSKYADTWFSQTSPDVQFFENFEQAISAIR